MSKPNCKLHVTIRRETDDQKDVIAEVRFYHKTINGTDVMWTQVLTSTLKCQKKQIAWRMKIRFL